MKHLLILSAWLFAAVSFAAATWWLYGRNTPSTLVFAIFCAFSAAVCGAQTVFAFQDALEAADDEKGEWW